jgi:hypothetical protein
MRVGLQNLPCQRGFPHLPRPGENLDKQPFFSKPARSSRKNFLPYHYLLKVVSKFTQRHKLFYPSGGFLKCSKEA